MNALPIGLCTAALVTAAALGGNTPVRVVIDMDASAPGIQSSVTVTSCTDVVRDVAVYIVDPLAQREVWSIGYLGGLNRGIAFGHRPDPSNVGGVLGLGVTLGAPVNPGSTGGLVFLPRLDPGFAGPEVQYVEFGADAPAVIPASAAPIFTVDIMLGGAHPGDRFHFYLLDYVAVWSGGTGGAFSTQDAINALDTGGDSVPDGTASIYGIDPDVAVPVPPASYPVDYIDGNGGATIEVVAVPGDLDRDGTVATNDLLALLAQWGDCRPGGPCVADLDFSGNVDVVDLLILLKNWGGDCPVPEQVLCERTDGFWDVLSCGHYFCGQFPDCDAIIPGCDCGPGRNFEAGVGCVDDPVCDQG